jgi:hypothetical protein
MAPKKKSESEDRPPLIGRVGTNLKVGKHFANNRFTIYRWAFWECQMLASQHSSMFLPQAKHQLKTFHFVQSIQTKVYQCLVLTK